MRKSGDSDCYFDQAFEAQVIDTLLNTHNEQACLIDMAHTPTQFFTELQSNCPRLFNEMTALIDRGALLTSSTSKLVIEALIDSVEATNPKANALYLDEQHMHIRSVTHKHLNFAITGTRITEALQRYCIQLEDLPLFLFLDLSRTTGTDVKRPYRDRAGLTVGKEQTVTEIIQAAMRERQLLLDDAQSIIWVLFKSLYQQINSTNEQFDPKQLFYWMLRNEAKQIENKVIMRAYQGIYQLIEGIIWKRIHNKQVPYSDYSERLEQLCPSGKYV
jgi:hypothetical protein